MSLTKVSYSMINGAAVNILDYGAVGDGATDDTAAIQAAIDAAIAQGADVCYPAGTYKQGPVTLTNAVNISIYGDGATINAFGDMSSANDNTNRNAVFKLAGTCSRVTFSDLNIVGDGVLANKQRGIGYNYSTPPTLTDINVVNCTFKNLLIAVILPGVNRAKLYGNTVDTTLGNASGQGLGFVTELAGATNPNSVNIENNTFYRTTRHAIYTNFLENGAIVGNQFREHAPSFAGGTTTGKWAVAVSRCFGVSVTSNSFWQCKDGALGVDQDSTYTVSGITVTGNTFYDTNGASLFVGRTVATGECLYITVTGNTFIPSGAYNDPDIVITDVKRLKFADNVIDANRGYASTKYIIDISEYDAAYFEDVDISNNICSVSSSGNSFLVRLSSGLSASSGGKFYLINNRVTGATREYLYAPSGACTNSKIITDWQYEQDITTSGTPSIAGYNNFSVTLASPGNITSFANGYDQKQIKLYFANGNATLTNAMYLASATNFTGSSSDYMQLVYRASSVNWFEVSRSIN